VPPSYPIHDLQVVAARVADILVPGAVARRVVIYDDRGVKILDVAVPACACAAPGPAAEPEVPALTPGWSFVAPERGGGQVALFDGKVVAAVSAGRVKLLRVLFEAVGPLPAKDVALAAFGEHGDPENARFHLRKLRDELKAAFPEFEGEAVSNDGGGYKLVLR
jgi:hypothetical protein